MSCEKFEQIDKSYCGETKFWTFQSDNFAICFLPHKCNENEHFCRAKWSLYAVAQRENMAYVIDMKCVQAEWRKKVLDQIAFSGRLPS